MQNMTKRTFMLQYISPTDLKEIRPNTGVNRKDAGDNSFESS